MSTIEAGTSATGASWFDLARHGADDTVSDVSTDEPETGANGDDDEVESTAADVDTEDEEIEGADQLGDAGKQALQRMKEQLKQAKKELGELKESVKPEDGKSDAGEVRRARKEASEARRKASDLARKVAEFEDREKSELERAQSAAERSAEQATKAVARSVRSEIKVAATGTFADASDAIDVLMREPSKYVDADGEIDTDAIEADLTDLLERKPHWAKPEPVAEVDPEAKKPKVKPDPGQGSRGGSAKVDFRTASDEDVQAELAKIGFRKRW